MIIMSVDFGDARTGIAVCGKSELIASPVTVIAEKDLEKCAEKTVQSCIELIERMLYGNAMIAFHKQDGTFCMEQGTLVGYEKDFHREFKITSRQMSVVYWSMEQHAWRRFMIGNLLEWKAIV